MNDAPIITRGGFLRGILAAGVAPAIIPVAEAHSVAGVRRGLALRQAMAGGGADDVIVIPPVSDSLSLYFDAKQSRGDTSKWTDLSGNGRHGTFIGNVAFENGCVRVHSSSSPYGKIQFDGVLTDEHTVEVIAKITSRGNFGRLTAEFSFPSLYCSQNDGEGLQMYGYGSDYVALRFNTSAYIDTLSVNQFGYSGGKVSVYQQGAFCASYNSQKSNGSSVAYLGNRADNGRGLDADYYAFAIHNRHLTAEEHALNAAWYIQRFGT